MRERLTVPQIVCGGCRHSNPHAAAGIAVVCKSEMTDTVSGICKSTATERDSHSRSAARLRNRRSTIIRRDQS